MTKAIFKDAEQFKKIIEVIKELVSDSCNFEFRENGIHLSSMDSAHVSMVYLYLSDEYFEEYIYDKDIVVGLNIPILHKVLGCFDKDKTMTIEPAVDVTKIYCETNDKNLSFTVSNVTIESEGLSLPSLENQVYVDFSSKYLNKLMKDIYDHGNDVKLTVYENFIDLNVMEDGSSVNVDVRIKHDDNSVKIIETEDMNMKFSLKYIHIFTKAHSLNERVQLYLYNEMPLRIKYTIVSDVYDDESSFIEFYLAPKANEE